MRPRPEPGSAGDVGAQEVQLLHGILDICFHFCLTVPIILEIGDELEGNCNEAIHFTVPVQRNERGVTITVKLAYK